MATFRYTAKDFDAKTFTGKISAADQSAVVDELRKRKLIIISIEEERASSLMPSSALKTAPIKSEDVILFSRQMATMVDAGIPILQTVDALHEQTTNPSFKRILATVCEDIRLGSSLSAAFAKHPRIFDGLFINMIRVGETGGVLTTVLERLSSYMEKTERLKRKVGGALIYPMVIVSMSMTITLALLIFVVPTFSTIYASFNRELPAMTQVLMNVSNTLKNNFPLLLVAAGAIVGAFQLFKRTESGAYQLDGLKLKLPVFGDLLKKVAVSRFCRTLSVLLQSGVPILEGLDIVRKTIGNRVLEQVIEEVISSVREGESISAPLSRSKVFPSMVTKMVSVGEQSGQLDKMLVKVADFFDEQVDAAVETLTSLIEPFIIGFLGIVIGFIVVALFLPIISITQML
ncbi:MAG: type II secretion system F family protein [Candidatus Omnitrophica bacterium]|nr:type II secretion system F family protein [Candidatus Omnitrophota bacterium]